MNRYITFYMNGRDDVADGNVTADIDLEVIAEAIIKAAWMDTSSDTDPSLIRDRCMNAAATALGPLRNADKAAWLKENAADIKRAGFRGPTSHEAFNAFMQGRIDELAHSIEPDLLVAIDVILNTDEEDGDGDDEETVEGDV